MSLWGALSTAWSVGRDVEGAAEAAGATLDAGGSPLDALRAFAAASENQLDDGAVEVLEDALRRTIAGLVTAADVTAWLAEQGPRVRGALDACLAVVRAVHASTAAVLEHEAELRAAVERVVAVAGDLGYQAGRLRATLRAWS